MGPDGVALADLAGFETELRRTPDSGYAQRVLAGFKLRLCAWVQVFISFHGPLSLLSLLLMLRWPFPQQSFKLSTGWRVDPSSTSSLPFLSLPCSHPHRPPKNGCTSCPTSPPLMSCTFSPGTSGARRVSPARRGAAHRTCALAPGA